LADLPGVLDTSIEKHSLAVRQTLGEEEQQDGICGIIMEGREDSNYGEK
jgi:hypothetical protein